MNKELIDRNELLSIYKKWIPQLALPEDEGDKRGVETCIVVLESAPVIDAVEVIRCKDCRFLIDRPDGTHGCYRHFIEGCKLDDFCSYGEKRHENR